ncbi:MAG: hypothetical protein M3336_05430 [Chloroflexota bacterium]|nr:hypothetical protein [Chloroflexota bacterium]
MRPPYEPSYRAELPRLDKEGPVGYRRGLQLEERLTGLGVALLGMAGLLVAYLIGTGVLPAGLPPPPPPPGVVVQVPLLNANACLVPMMAIGSLSLIYFGFRRAIDP